MGTEFSPKARNVKMTERCSYRKKGNQHLTSVLGTCRKGSIFKTEAWEGINNFLIVSDLLLGKQRVK